MNDKPQGGSLQDYLELVRLPNIFTAMADVAMGFLFVQGVQADQSEDLDKVWQMQFSDARTLLLLAAGSVLLYAAGVVLNDVFDVQTDRQDRPERPIPSGRVSLVAARRAGWLLLLAGVATAWIASLFVGQLRPGLVGTLLAACVVLYDAGLKRTPLGPAAMGVCRALNVLLGMSVAAGVFRSEYFLAAGSIGIYVMGLTWMAKGEARPSGRRRLVAATVVMMAGIGLLIALPLWAGSLFSGTWGQELYAVLSWRPVQWYLPMGLLGAIIGWRCVRAVAEPSPGRVQMAVTQGIMFIVFLDAAGCFAARGRDWAFVVLSLWLPAMLAGRFFKST
jgi:4-hydroxybenzoate polyprenyltransferase